MNAALTAVVNGLLVSAIMTAGLWLVMKFVSKRFWNAATRYLVWWAALLLTILTPLLYTSERREPVAAHQSGGVPGVNGLQQQALRASADQNRPLANQQAFPPAAGSSSSHVARAAPVRGSGFVRQPFPIRIVARSSWAYWICLIWMLAAAFMVARLIVSYFLLERRKADADADSAYQARLDEWLARCGAGRRKIRLAFSGDIAAPIAAGPYRPSILIPHRMLERLNDDELNHVGLHEAAHFRRRDDFALILQRLIEAVFVFHPVVHWITRRIDLEREIACDDFVVQLTGSARCYAACLTRVAELVNGACAAGPAVSATEPRSDLEARVEMLLDSSRKTSTSLLKLRLAGAVGSLCLVLGMAAAMPGLLLLATPAAAEEAGSLRPAVAAFSEPIPSQPVESPKPQAISQAPQAGNPVPGTSVASTLVEIPVFVTDPRNRYVSGLGKEHFKIFEGGIEQSIAAVSSGDPISVAFVYEIQDAGSGAEVLQRATDVFKTTAKSGDEFWILYGLNGRVEISSGLQNSDEIVGRLKSPAGVPVPLADELRDALGVLNASRNMQKIIVVLSDGDEHFSPITPRYAAASDQDAYAAGVHAGHNMATLGMANAGDARIYAISLTPLYPVPASTLGAPSGPAVLDEITESTGGRHLAIASAPETQRAATTVDVEIRNLYLVQYRRENTALAGKDVGIRVEIHPPLGIRALYAHARPGYALATQSGTFSTIDQAALRARQSVLNLSSSDPVIISDTEGLDFTGYLKGISDRVRSNWFSKIPEAAKQGQKGGVQVTFTILRDGTIQAARVSKGSGTVSFDQASLESVQAAAPFSALPQRFTQDRIVVQLSFFYNLN